MKFLLRLLINSVVLLLIGYYIPGIVVSGWYAAIITIIILGLVNAVIGTVLKILAMPITILTLGLFTLIINGLMFWFVASFVKGFDVINFTSAFLGALILSLVSSFVNFLMKK